MGLYYINKEVCFDSINSSLSSLSRLSSRHLKLDYLESLSLSLLIERANQLVSYDDFLQFWRSSEVTEGSLSRVISMLRKKLRDSGLSESVIINTAKKGYTLVATIDEAVEVSSVHAFFKRYVKKYILKIGVVFLFVFLFLFYFIITDFRKVEYDEQKIRYIELLNNSDIKIEFSYNNWTDQVAYTKKSVNDDYWGIEIFNLFDGRKLSINEQNHNLSKSTWLSSSEIVYRSYNEFDCSIVKASIRNKIESVKLFPCNPDSYASAIALFGHDKLLITDSILNQTSASLFIGDLKSGSIHKVNIDDGGGAGFYNVITTPNSKLVVLLSSIDGNSYKIQLVDPDNNWEQIWAEEVQTINLSAGWDGTSLSFKNDLGGVSIVTFNGKDEVYRRFIPLLAPAYNISTANRGIMLTSGEFFGQDISYFDRSVNKKVNFTSGTNSKNTHATFISEEKIIYISNRTGLNQIWLYDIETQASVQLSKFKDWKKVKNVAIDSENKLVALQIGRNTELYAYNDFSSVIKVFSGTNPVFFNNSLLYYSNERYYRYSLNDKDLSELNIDGVKVIKNYGDRLYYSKIYFPGVWLYNPSGDDKLVLELESASYQWFISNNGAIIYRDDTGRYFYSYIDSGIIVDFNKDCGEPVAMNSKYCLSKSLVKSDSRLLLVEWD